MAFLIPSGLGPINQRPPGDHFLGVRPVPEEPANPSQRQVSLLLYPDIVRGEVSQPDLRETPILRSQCPHRSWINPSNRVGHPSDASYPAGGSLFGSFYLEEQA